MFPGYPALFRGTPTVVAGKSPTSLGLFYGGDLDINEMHPFAEHHYFQPFCSEPLMCIRDPLSSCTRTIFLVVGRVVISSPQVPLSDA